MEKLHWSIEAAAPGEVGVIGLRIRDTQDADAPWQFYFTGVSLAAYPRVIEAAIQEVGSGFNAVGVTFPGDYDEWDISQHGEIPADMVQLYHHDFGQVYMPRATFYTILLAFAERLLERPGQPASWYEAMRTALTKLQAKMAADAARVSATEHL